MRYSTFGLTAAGGQSLPWAVRFVKQPGRQEVERPENMSIRIKSCIQTPIFEKQSCTETSWRRRTGNAGPYSKAQSVRRRRRLRASTGKYRRRRQNWLRWRRRLFPRRGVPPGGLLCVFRSAARADKAGGYAVLCALSGLNMQKIYSFICSLQLLSLTVAEFGV